MSKTGNKSLPQQIILITGAAEGLGRELALELSSQGATIILLDHEVPMLESLYDEIIEAGSPEPAIYPMQLAGATVEDFNAIPESIRQTFGRLDGIIHNAAICKALTPLPLISFEVWAEVMQVNLNAPFLLTQACLPLLKESDDAFIMFISDRVTEEDQNHAYRGAYGVSKAALDEFARILEDEVSTNTNIRVLRNDPGPMRTRLRARMFPAQKSDNVKSAKEAVKTIIDLIAASVNA